MKKGGSAALAAMLRQRSEVGPSTAAPLASPSSDAAEAPKPTHPAALAFQSAVHQAHQAHRAASPTPPARAMSPVRAISPMQRAPSTNDGPLLISHPKRSFSPTPAARNASPTPGGGTSPVVPAGIRSTSPTPALRSMAPPPPPPAPAAPPRSISPNVAALPKTIPFNGANKCHVCEKTVYKMEEIIAVGAVWHDKCFTCGGKTLASTGCGRVLRRDGYVDHDGEPFCQACYGKLYRPKGFNVGVGINTDFGESTPVDVSHTPVNSNSTPVVSAPVVVPTAPVVSAPVVSAPISVVAAPAVEKPRPPAPVVPPVPSTTSQPPLPTTTTTSTGNSTGTSALGGGNKCSICTKTVYKMEEIIALGRIFHDKCFTCGGVHRDGCGKVLKRDGYVDHENEPYCTPCYQRMFGPKTFGYGLSAESTVANGAQAQAATTNNIPPAAAITATNASKPAVPPPPPPAAPAAPPASLPAAPGMAKNQSVTGKVTIGTTSKADASGLFKESGYVGDNDEVDESEW